MEALGLRLALFGRFLTYTHYKDDTPSSSCRLPIDFVHDAFGKKMVIFAVGFCFLFSGPFLEIGD